MKYDYKALYEKNAAFYHARPNAKKALKLASPALTLLFFVAYAALLVYGAFENRFAPYDFVKVFFSPLLALLLVSVLRLAIERPRPYSAHGSAVTPLKSRKGRDNDSFPSRHLACAFVISMMFLPYLPFAGIGLLLASGLLGYVRFALGLHYPSDLAAGGAIGLACGVLIFL